MHLALLQRARNVLLDCLDHPDAADVASVIAFVLAQPIRPATREARMVLVHSLVATKSWTNGYAMAFVDDYAGRAQPTHPVAQLGFAVAPMEPTPAMIAAGWDVEELVTPDRVWRAMMATHIHEQAAS